jgi:hypothetical protein
LKAVWNLKRETFQLLVKQHCKNVVVISPMEVLDIKDSVEGVRSAMSDGIHLNKESLDRVVDHVIQSVEGGKGGRGGGPGGGRGRGGVRTFSSYGPY